MPRQHGIEIHLLESSAPVLDDLARNGLEALHPHLGQTTAVTLHDSDDDIGTTLRSSLALVEHCEGFADPWSSSEVDPKVTGGLDDIGDVGLARCRLAHSLIGSDRRWTA